MRDPREARAIVSAGYDAIAETYLRARLELISDEEQGFLARVIEALPRGPLVVDLGCGAGVPFTAALAQVATVVAIDLSAEQLRLAPDPGARRASRPRRHVDPRPPPRVGRCGDGVRLDRARSHQRARGLVSLDRVEQDGSEGRWAGIVARLPSRPAR